MRASLSTLSLALLATVCFSQNAFAEATRGATRGQGVPEKATVKRPSTKKAAQKESTRTQLERPGQTQVTTLTREREAKMSTFALSVGGITDGEAIDPRFAFCKANGSGGTEDADNISPFISWSPPPLGTRSLALIVVDKDVPATFDTANVPGQVIENNAPRQNFYHWVLVDIPTNVSSILEGKDSNGIVPGGKPFGTMAYGLSGQNDYVKVTPGDHGGYDGPCPPWNDRRLHHYHFTLYALDIPSLKLPSPVTGPQAMIAMKDHILAQSEIIGTYTTNRDWLENQSKKPGHKNKAK